MKKHKCIIQGNTHKSKPHSSLSFEIDGCVYGCMGWDVKRDDDNLFSFDKSWLN